MLLLVAVLGGLLALPAAGPDAAAAARVPVVVVPGITGSYLSNSGGEVWPDEGRTARSLRDDHLDVLRLAADGRTPAGTGAPTRSSWIAGRATPV